MPRLILVFSVQAEITITPSYISDVPSFISNVIEINETINNKKNREVFFTGDMGNLLSYELLPTLLREDPKGKGKKVYLEVNTFYSANYY